MIKKQGTTLSLAAAFFALCIMTAFYFGSISRGGGIVIHTDRSTSKTERSTAVTSDLDRYFEPADVKETAKTDTGTSTLININTATADELDVLPGIGPVAAAKIIGYRQRFGNFLAIEEIKAVDGIGDGTYQKIQALIAVS